MLRSIVQAQELRVAARGDGVPGYGPFDGETWQVVGSTGFRPRAGQAFAAEWLHADHGTDHVPVDVRVADMDPGHDVLGAPVHARVDPQGEPETGVGDVGERIVDARRREAGHVQDRSEVLGVEVGDGFDLDHGGWTESPFEAVRQPAAVDDALA